MRVVLQCSSSANKVQVIRAYREATGAGLAEAKAAVESSSSIEFQIPAEKEAFVLSLLQESGCVFDIPEDHMDMDPYDEHNDRQFLEFNCRYLKDCQNHYTLFGTEIKLIPPINRYFILTRFVSLAKTFSKTQFLLWTNEYRLNQYKINSIDFGFMLCDADDCSSFAYELISDYLLVPLQRQLVAFDIFDISTEGCINRCLALAPLENEMEELLQNSKQNRWRERGNRYFERISNIARAYTPAGDEILGLAKDVAGDLFSKIRSRKAANNTNTICIGISKLWQCIEGSFDQSLHQYINMINENVPMAIQEFELEPLYEKSNGLLENAKRFPAKAPQLLARAVEICPCNEAVLTFVFKKYPEFRKSIQQIGLQYGLDIK